MYKCSCLGLKQEDFDNMSAEELQELFDTSSCCGNCKTELDRWASGLCQQS